MNNNNIYNNNNNFVGTTHLDSYKITSNFIISTSNIIESHLYSSNIANSNYTSNTSNILELHSRAYTDLLENKISKLIREETEHISIPIAGAPISTDLIHTYINNSNLAGEIRFWVSTASSFPPQIPTDDLPYRVKISQDGKLYCYYTYNALINATLNTCWIDVANTIAGILASTTNIGIVIGGLQIEINDLAIKENNDILAVYNTIIAANNGDLPYSLEEFYDHRDAILNGLSPEVVRTGLQNAVQSARDFISTGRISYLNQVFPSLNQAIIQNPVFGFFLGAGGVVFGLLYGASVTGQFNNYLNVLVRNISSNSNLTNTDKTNIIQETCNVITSNYVDLCSSNYFININQGFINSNIITYQNIPQIQTSNIYVLNSGNINGVGTAYVNVCAAKSLSTTLNTNVGFPTFDAFGGIGDKILLRNGSATTCPISIGVDSNYSLWNSITSNNANTAFDWYIDGDKKMSIYRDKLETSNLLIFQNGISIPSITQTTILNETPNVYKKYAFNFSCSTAITISETTYYKYDIDLRSYTQTKPSANPSSPYRIFNIRLFLSSVYFQVMTNNTYNILNYEVYMSNEINAGSDGGVIGINIFANHIGNTPPNPLLVNILPSYFTLLRTANFNYLSVISTIQNINLNCIIQDILY